jgi:hypothetical protein
MRRLAEISAAKGQFVVNAAYPNAVNELLLEKRSGRGAAGHAVALLVAKAKLVDSEIRTEFAQARALSNDK